MVEYQLLETSVGLVFAVKKWGHRDGRQWRQIGRSADLPPFAVACTKYRLVYILSYLHFSYIERWNPCRVSLRRLERVSPKHPTGVKGIFCWTVMFDLSCIVTVPVAVPGIVFLKESFMDDAMHISHPSLTLTLLIVQLIAAYGSEAVGLCWWTLAPLPCCLCITRYH